MVRAYIDTNWIDSAKVYLEQEASMASLCALIPIEIRKDTIKTKVHLATIQAAADNLYTKDPNSRKAEEISDFCTFYTGILKVSNRTGGFYALTKDEKLQLEEISRKETAIASNAKAILDFIEERPREYNLEGPSEMKMMNLISEDIEEIESLEMDFKIHPNPTNGQIILTIANITELGENVYYEITDLTGRTIAKIKVNQETVNYEFDKSANGMYIVSLIDESQVIGLQRVILSDN